MVVGLGAQKKPLLVNVEAVRFFAPGEAFGELSNFFYTTQPPRDETGRRRFRHQFRDANGARYTSMEQFFAKRKQEHLAPGDLDAARDIMRATPGRAKAIARKLKFKETWNDEAEAVMAEGLAYKFGQNKALRDILVSTYPRRLIEENARDDVWGAGATGNGQNKLGRLLAKERSKYV